jgi:hypothetical protein
VVTDTLKELADSIFKTEASNPLHGYKASKSRRPQSEDNVSPHVYNTESSEDG